MSTTISVLTKLANEGELETHESWFAFQPNSMDPETGAIDGVKPKRLLQPGEAVEFPAIGKQPIKVKRLKGRDDYSCSCPTYQYGPVTGLRGRTCKHLNEVLGDAYEANRLRTVAQAPSSRPIASSTGPLSPFTPQKGSGSKRSLYGRDDVKAPATAVTKMPRISTNEPSSSQSKGRVALMLAHPWDLKGSKSPEGMWASEKLDGVRAHWDGSRMWSRTGKEYSPPEWWKARLPRDVQLDGELFCERDSFDKTSGAVRAGASQAWRHISYIVFDTINFGLTLEKRWEHARLACVDGEKTVDEIVEAQGSLVAFLTQIKIKSRSHLDQLLASVEELGGEGLMLRRADSLYKSGRSYDLLKVKTFYDAEAIVVGYNAGEGRNKGRVGSLRVVMACGKVFDVGTGLTDSLREHPPEVGQVIVYAFQELSHEGTPRFPSYKGVAADKTRARDAVVRSAALRAGPSSIAAE